MCGPIALVASQSIPVKVWTRKLWYHIGRACTYAVLGLLIGLVGKSLQMAGIQQSLSISLGLLIIVMAVFFRKKNKLPSSRFFAGFTSSIKANLGLWLKRKGGLAFFVTGLVNGLLPCGMVYIALVATLALSDPWQGSLYMAAFGLGTTPLLLGLMLGHSLVNLKWRQRIFNSMPYFAMFIGVMFIMRGMGLGLHMLSPVLDFGFGASTADSMTICQ
ncbi:membrane protein [Echinicola pacifica]|uniref:Membrane protein n=2 Tax=Echinicola pacifica TaxID=346377 RepID=A0A918PMD8_9BACT|nr:membrane protein [Echinicola pacifica]